MFVLFVCFVSARDLLGVFGFWDYEVLFILVRFVSVVCVSVSFEYCEVWLSVVVTISLIVDFGWCYP